jgi:hypothetical protein
MDKYPTPGSYAGAAIQSLPFVSRRSRWTVPKAYDYASATEIGVSYARHFSAWLRDNPELLEANALYVIIRDMAPTFTNGEDHGKGYAVGFLTEIQRRLAA